MKTPLLLSALAVLALLPACRSTKQTRAFYPATPSQEARTVYIPGAWKEGANAGYSQEGGFYPTARERLSHNPTLDYVRREDRRIPDPVHGRELDNIVYDYDVRSKSYAPERSLTSFMR
jgi:hypothetical protein